MQKKYEMLMRKCLSLAKKSCGSVSPNPLVGCVIFDDDFNIISRGRHEKYGQNHAERNAILNSPIDVGGKSLIVNLEPCCHQGKTPPCTDLIIESGIKRVILGMTDPNPLVAGKGIKKLKDAGIEVITGVLEPECFELNKIFIKNKTENKPYVTIKTASTLDGKIAGRTGKPEKITDEASWREVHKLRNYYDAVLTSSTTVINDNPRLTCRMRGGRNPVRIIFDKNLITPQDSNVYNNDGTKVYIVTSENVSCEKINKYPKHVEIIKCSLKNGYINLNSAVRMLYDKGIMSILVESGGTMNKSFIEERLADELIQFVAPKIMGDDTAISCVKGFNREYISKCNNLKAVSTKLLKGDIIIVCKFIK